MSFNHAVVWLDHSEAHILHFSDDASEGARVHARSKHQHQHHKSGARGSGNAGEDRKYYDEIAQVMGDAGEILVVGPSSAKLQLMKHLERNHRAVADKVVGIESVDHPSDGQLLAYARHYFVAVDRMRGDPQANK